MSTHAIKVEALQEVGTVSGKRLQTNAGRYPSSDILRQVTAAYIDTAMAARQAHWNVRGEHALKWYDLFEALYHDLDSHAGAIAERLVALGATPPGTVQIVTTTTSMVPFPADMREAADLIEAIIVRLGQLATLTRRALAELERQGDPVTVHTLSEAAAAVEKQLWAIESQSRPN